MKVQEIRIKAKQLGVNPNKMKKTDLIRAIQRAEANIDCYATDRVAHCGETQCLWRVDCLGENGKV